MDDLNPTEKQFIEERLAQLRRHAPPLQAVPSLVPECENCGAPLPRLSLVPECEDCGAPWVERGVTHWRPDGSQLCWWLVTSGW
jgi:predicted amidophosphoribosyltransferase